MDCEGLIDEVKKRPALWDINYTEYNNREIVAQKWEEVARIIGRPKIEVLKKWRSLRDNYRSELKKIEVLKLQGSSSEACKRKWVHMEQISFLYDIISEPRLKKRKNYYKSQPQSNVQITQKLSSHHTNSRNYERDRNRNRDPLSTVHTDILDKFKNENALNFDGDYNFLISFLPIMKSLNHKQKLEFRIRMDQLAYNMKHSQYPSTTCDISAILPTEQEMLLYSSSKSHSVGNNSSKSNWDEETNNKNDLDIKIFN